jgi:hypothetical protein
MKRNHPGSRAIKSQKSSIKTRRLYGGMDQDWQKKRKEDYELRRAAEAKAEEAARLAALPESDRQHLEDANNQRRMVEEERERQRQLREAEAEAAKKLAEDAASAQKKAESEMKNAAALAERAKKHQSALEKARKEEEKRDEEKKKEKDKQDEEKKKEDEAKQKRLKDNLEKLQKQAKVREELRAGLGDLIQKTAESKTLDDVLGAMKKFHEYVKKHSMKEMEVDIGFIPPDKRKDDDPLTTGQILDDLHTALQNALNGIKLDYGKKGKDATIRELDTMWKTICATLETEFPLSFDTELSAEDIRNQAEEDAKIAADINAREQQERNLREEAEGLALARQLQEREEQERRRQDEEASLEYARQLQEREEQERRRQDEAEGLALARQLQDQGPPPADIGQVMRPNGGIDFGAFRNIRQPQPQPQPQIVPNRALENIIMQTRANLWIPFIASAVNLGDVPGYTWMPIGSANGAGYRSNAVMNVRFQAQANPPPRFIAAAVNFVNAPGYIWRQGSLGLGYYRDQRRGGLRTKKHKNNRKNNISRRARK